MASISSSLTRHRTRGFIPALTDGAFQPFSLSAEKRLFAELPGFNSRISATHFGTKTNGQYLRVIFIDVLRIYFLISFLCGPFLLLKTFHYFYNFFLFI